MPRLHPSVLITNTVSVLTGQRSLRWCLMWMCGRCQSHVLQSVWTHERARPRVASAQSHLQDGALDQWDAAVQDQVSISFSSGQSVSISSISILSVCRFYFPGWYGSGSNSARRYGVTKSSETPVLDDITTAYLFAQVRRIQIHDNVISSLFCLCFDTFIAKS